MQNSLVLNQDGLHWGQKGYYRSTSEKSQSDDVRTVSMHGYGIE